MTRMFYDSDRLKKNYLRNFVPTSFAKVIENSEETFLMRAEC